ncbi:hypothetical protein [Phytoactinopolyspora halotolerans]|uniref:Uncharacterized protein n=1 Tax=Phytoactinopolyspora halotolerans TaxID=1981512 RepID=A0A6L9SK61_9ACTN|nr:hypothetical protein [Phytoactinopolyspora halotolerans]NEE04480.1 hypothetical protein [Phytoactinopolyspora halotolerans]
MSTIGDEKLAELRSMVETRPAPPPAEIHARAATLRRVRRRRRIGVATTIGVAGLVTASIAAFSPSIDQDGETIPWVLGAPPASAASTNCHYFGGPSDLLEPTDVRADLVYLPPDGTVDAPLQTVSATETQVECPLSDLDAVGLRRDAEGNVEAAISVYGPTLGRYEPVDGRSQEVSMREGSGYLLTWDESASQLALNWSEDGSWWAAQAVGLDADELLDVMEAIRIDHDQVVASSFLDGFEVVVPQSLVGKDVHEWSVSYGRPDEEPLLNLIVSSATSSPAEARVVSVPGAIPAEVVADDPSVSGFGVFEPSVAGASSLSWDTPDGRRFELQFTGDTGLGEALDIAESLGRISTSDKHITDAWLHPEY